MTAFLRIAAAALVLAAAVAVIVLRLTTAPPMVPCADPFDGGKITLWCEAPAGIWTPSP
jgi:hypothetical protein